MGDKSTGSPPMPIIWREDSDPLVYETARVGRVFNHRRPRRYPIAVVEASEEKHIVEAVRLARKLECRVSVRSGGHSWAAWSVRDETVLIDLGNFKDISFDEKKGIVSATPSTTGRELNKFLNDKGYMFGGGHCPDVGLGGFLLQGGMGWNCKNWGWACERVAAIDVVTAAGELIHCDSQQNSDLLWAARGAGPGFPGIVTRFYLEVRPKFHNMLASNFVYPISEYRPVMDWILKLAPECDDSVEVAVVSVTPPGMSQLCIIPLFVAFNQTVEESKAALEAANETRPPGILTEMINQPTSLADQYREQGNANPLGHRYCAENAYISNSEDVASVMEKAFTELPHPKAFALWYAMNPCSQRPLADMAVSMQSDHYFALYTIWEDEMDDDRCQQWVRDIMKDVERHADGAYLGDSDFQIRRTKFWADEKSKKLMALRRRWDPEGRVCGYLDIGDASGVNGLENEHEWKVLADQKECS